MGKEGMNFVASVRQSKRSAGAVTGGQRLRMPTGAGHAIQLASSLGPITARERGQRALEERLGLAEEAGLPRGPTRGASATSLHQGSAELQGDVQKEITVA